MILTFSLFRGVERETGDPPVGRPCYFVSSETTQPYSTQEVIGYAFSFWGNFQTMNGVRYFFTLFCFKVSELICSFVLITRYELFIPCGVLSRLNFLRETKQKTTLELK